MTNKNSNKSSLDTSLEGLNFELQKVTIQILLETKALISSNSIYQQAILELLLDKENINQEKLVAVIKKAQASVSAIMKVSDLSAGEQFKQLLGIESQNLEAQEVSESDESKTSKLLLG